MRVRGRPLYAPEQPRAHPLGALTTPPRRPSVVRPGHNVVISRSGGRSLGSRAARHQHRDEPRRRPWPDQLAENFFARWGRCNCAPWCSQWSASPPAVRASLLHTPRPVLAPCCAAQSTSIGARWTHCVDAGRCKVRTVSADASSHLPERFREGSSLRGSTDLVALMRS